MQNHMHNQIKPTNPMIYRQPSNVYTVHSFHQHLTATKTTLKSNQNNEKTSKNLESTQMEIAQPKIAQKDTN